MDTETRSPLTRAVAMLLSALVALVGIPLTFAGPAGADCPTLGPTDHWIGSYTINGGTGSFFNEGEVASDGAGNISGSITAPNPNVISGTLTCDHVVGSVTGYPGPGNIINFEGTLAANGNELINGFWYVPNSSISGSWGSARVTREQEELDATELTTDPGNVGASPAEPLQVSISSPTQGDLRVELGASANPVLAGYQLLDQVVHIEAPPATPEAPLAFQFVLDASTIPAGVAASQVQVFRNGSLVADCDANAGAAAIPDPCIVSRVPLAGGDVQISIRTSAASVWSFGVSAGFTGLQISTSGLVPAHLGQPYTATLHADGGTAPYKWKKLSKLPKGLKLKKTGLIAGVPKKVTGTFQVTVQVTYRTKLPHERAVIHSATRVLSITVT